MFIFSRLTKELRQSIGLLSIGTFLEYFDLFLYVHMSILVNDLFFPPVDTKAQSLLRAFAFCSSFLFRPLGALLFGYIGDKYGRKLTVRITTFTMAITCLIMANIPTYYQIGILATWVITICRILQGISCIGEIVDAQLFLTEATPLPSRFPVVGLINIFGTLGVLCALGIAALTTSYGFNWRVAFWIGAGVAVIGSVARTNLRESPEFADARKRLKNIAIRANESIEKIKKKSFYNQKVSTKTATAYFLIMCAGPTFLYFAYFYSATIFKNVFHYQPHQILIHNLLLGVIELFGFVILRTYLTTFLHPLKILRFTWVVLFAFTLCLPWLMNHVTTVWHLFFIQIFIVLFRLMDFPAAPIFFKNFPVFRRFSYASFLHGLAYAIIYMISSFGLIHLTEWCGYVGLWILMIPVLIGYGYALNYFKNLEKAAGRYPKLITWNQDAEE